MDTSSCQASILSSRRCVGAERGQNGSMTRNGDVTSRIATAARCAETVSPASTPTARPRSPLAGESSSATNAKTHTNGKAKKNKFPDENWDQILPSQLWRVTDWQPEKKLWLGVLEDGCRSFFAERDSIATHRNRKEACEWVMSTAYYIGSFKWICEMLGQDDWRVRRKLVTRKQSGKGNPFVSGCTSLPTVRAIRFPTKIVSTGETVG